jgi:hypothetical protein
MYEPRVNLRRSVICNWITPGIVAFFTVSTVLSLGGGPWTAGPLAVLTGLIGQRWAVNAWDSTPEAK